MRELTLDEMKEIEFEVLRELDSFCRKNNIRYFISHGTLLGAIRYKGFIPWDDDIDVLVPREDYNRLLTLYQDNEKYRLLSYEKDKRFLLPYAKLVDMNTVKEEISLDSSLKLGLDVDVFPLDAWSDDYETALKEVKYIGRNGQYLWLTKLSKPDSVQPLKRFVKGIVMAFVKMRGSEYYLHRIMKQCVKYNGTATKYLGNKAWNVYKQKDVLPAEAFAEAIEVEFNGEKFPTMVGYDTFLSSLYGDYMPEPPKEKQKTHHKFKAYKL